MSPDVADNAWLDGWSRTEWIAGASSPSNPHQPGVRGHWRHYTPRVVGIVRPFGKGWACCYLVDGAERGLGECETVQIAKDRCDAGELSIVLWASLHCWQPQPHRGAACSARGHADAHADGFNLSRRWPRSPLGDLCAREVRHG